MTPRPPAARTGSRHLLPRRFFEQDAVTVARALLGKRLRIGRTEGIIVESEAYAADPASHVVTRPYAARPIMAKVAFVYVYRIYGVHLCINLTCDRTQPAAVLIRALEPTSDLAGMARRRGLDGAPGDRRIRRLLCSGPARLTQALGVTMAMNDAPVGKVLRVLDGPASGKVVATRRIGISKARDLRWRFVVAGSEYLSRKGGSDE